MGPDIVGDETLLRRALDGEADAFGQLFERHVDAVYTHCRRRGLNTADAEDLTSMVFLEAWRKADRMRIVQGSARAWLLVVATNLMRNFWRSRDRYDHLLSRLPRGEAEPDVAEAVVDDAENRQRARDLGDALGRLRQEEQEVVVLCDLGEVSYADAAEALGVPVGTVRSRLSRARSALRRMSTSGEAAPSASPEQSSEVSAR